VGRDPKTGQPHPRTSRHTIAALGHLRFGEHVHWTADVPPELDTNHHLVYFTGRTLDVFYPFDRYYQISEQNAKSEFSWKVRADLYLQTLGWWPPNDNTDPPNPGGSPLFLHEVLAQSDCRVLPNQERFNGDWCHVVERPGLEKLWIDPTIGFSLRRRERYARPKSILHTRYELWDYREVSTEIWIPFGFRRIIYDTRQAAATATPPVRSHAECTVEDVEVNQLSETLFRFTPPPGTLIDNRDTGEVKQVPGGVSFLVQVVDRAIIARGLFPPQRPKNVRWHRYPMVTALLLLVGLDLFLLCKGFLYSASRKPLDQQASVPTATNTS
jgi:hypothetical protein